MSQQRGPFSKSYGVTLDAVHQTLHDGYVFDLSHRATLASAADAMEIAITVPSTVEAYFMIDIGSEKIATLTIIEDVTGLSGGTSATAYNANRNSALTSGCTYKTGVPAGALSYSGGTTIYTRQVTTSGIIMAASFESERMLKSGATTIIRLVSGSNSCDASINVRLYKDPR
jgi:hypothetical protein